MKEINKVERVLDTMHDDVLPVSRYMTASECAMLCEISAAEDRRTGEKPSPEDIKYFIAENAYSYGFWWGWKYCETENSEYIGTLEDQIERYRDDMRDMALGLTADIKALIEAVKGCTPEQVDTVIGMINSMLNENKASGGDAE